MKTFRAFLVSLSLVVMPGLRADDAGFPSDAATSALRVQIKTPPSWDIISAQGRVAGSVLAAVRASLTECPLVELTAVENPAHLSRLLTLEVVQWRMSGSDTIDCTFSAVVRTSRGSQPIGRFDAAVRFPHFATGPTVEIKTDGCRSLLAILKDSGVSPAPGRT